MKHLQTIAFYRVTRFFALFSIAVLVLCSTAHAGIGETIDQIQKRYGAGRNVKPGMVYGIDEDKYSLTVYYLLGRSAMEIYSRARTQDGDIMPLSGDEITRFLKANRAGQGWKAWQIKKAAPGMYYWYRTDKKVMAGYNLKEGILIIRPMADTGGVF